MVSRLGRFGKAGGRRGAMWAAGVALCGLLLLGWLYDGYSVEIYRQVRRGLENAAGGVQAAVRKTSAFVLTHPYFAIREVKVLGAEKVKGADIVVMSGLGPHTRIWNIDPAEVEERVAAASVGQGGSDTPGTAGALGDHRRGMAPTVPSSPWTSCTTWPTTA